MTKRMHIDVVKVKLVRDRALEYGQKRICNPKELAELGRKFLKNADREMFLLVCLNGRNSINCIHLVSIGTMDKACVSPREIIKTALLSNSSSIAFIHNHPSGDPNPSREDMEITKSLKRCADLFEIKILDHVIVTDDGRYESFLERKILSSD